MNIDNIEIKKCIGCENYILYDRYINGMYDGQFEIQFDNGEFNGTVLHSGFDTENTDGSFDWIKVKNKKIYELVKEKAIKDYIQ